MTSARHGAERLRRLAVAAALDPTPMRDRLGGLHVPFESMGTEQCETRAATVLAGHARMAVVGPSGSGKTSFIWHALDQPRPEGVPRLAPLRISVGVEDEPVISSPRRFGQHIIETVTRDVRQRTIVRDRESARDRTEGRSRRTSAGVSVSLPLRVLSGELGAELEATLEHVVEPSGAEVLRLAGEIVSTMQDHGEYPVVVIDDSDQWLGRDEHEMVERFFGRIVPELIREWPCGLVLAVHDAYMSDGAYDPAAGFVDHVPLPRLPDAAAVSAIVAERVRVAEDGEGTNDPSRVFSREAAEYLFDFYVDHASIRKMLQRAHVALSIAVDDGHAQVDVRHVRAAAART